MARKTLKWSGLGGAGSRWFLFLLGVPVIGGFWVFAGVFFDGVRADGGADSDASEAMVVGVGGMVIALVMAAFWVAALVAAPGEASYPEVIAGLHAWAARHRWEVTDDMVTAAHWATRFHFSADDLTRPSAAARGWVHGRDAMILFTIIGTGDHQSRQTIIVVDADANYPVTAVVRHRRASSHDYGGAIPLESVEFERRWRAMGWDVAGSHAVFTPRVIERLLEPTPGGQPDIVWDGPGIRAADAGLIAEPMHLESRLLLLADLAGLTPAYQVTHTNDDPSLRPYVPPPMFRFTATLVDGAQMIKALGVLTWWVGVMLVFSPLPTGSKVGVVAVSAAVGLALYLSGGRLERLAKARRLAQWHAAHAAALGPPGGAQAPPQL